MTPFYRFFRWAARCFFALMGGIEVANADRLPATGAVIIAANHVSFADPPACGVASSRSVRFMAQAELFKPPVFRSIIRKLGAFPIHRGEADPAAIKTALALLERGEVLVVFPEGTRGDGKKLGPPQKGMTLIAARSGAPVVPTAITGTFRLLPKGAKVPKRSKVKVRFGEPIYYAQLVDQYGRQEAKAVFPKILMERIQALLKESGDKFQLPNSGGD